MKARPSFILLAFLLLSPVSRGAFTNNVTSSFPAIGYSVGGTNYFYLPPGTVLQFGGQSYTGFVFSAGDNLYSNNVWGMIGGYATTGTVLNASNWLGSPAFSNWCLAQFYPLTGNPSNYLTTIVGLTNSLAAQSWVTANFAGIGVTNVNLTGYQLKSSANTNNLGLIQIYATNANAIGMLNTNGWTFGTANAITNATGPGLTANSGVITLSTNAYIFLTSIAGLTNSLADTNYVISAIASNVPAGVLTNNELQATLGMVTLQSGELYDEQALGAVNVEARFLVNTNGTVLADFSSGTFQDGSGYAFLTTATGLQEAGVFTSGLLSNCWVLTESNNLGVVQGTNFGSTYNISYSYLSNYNGYAAYKSGTHFASYSTTYNSYFLGTALAGVLSTNQIAFYLPGTSPSGQYLKGNSSVTPIGQLYYPQILNSNSVLGASDTNAFQLASATNTNNAPLSVTNYVLTTPAIAAAGGVTNNGATINGGYIANGAAFTTLAGITVKTNSASIGNDQNLTTLNLIAGTGITVNGTNSGSQGNVTIASTVSTYTNSGALGAGVISGSAIGTNQTASTTYPVAQLCVFPTSGSGVLSVTALDFTIGGTTNRILRYGDGTTTNYTSPYNQGFTYTYASNLTATIVSNYANISEYGTLQTSVSTNLIIISPFALPVPSLSVSTTNVGNNTAMSFTNTSVGVFTNAFWNFGGGFTTNSTNTVISLTYTNTGTNSIALTLWSYAGTNTTNYANLVVVSAMSNGGLATIGTTSGSQFSVPNFAAEYPSGSFTVEMWIKRAGNASGNSSLYSTVDGGAFGHGLYGADGVNTNLTFFVYNPSGSSSCSGGGTNLHDGWQHICGRYDGNNIWLAVNGTNVASHSQTYPPASTSSPLLISTGQGASDCYNGTIAQFRMCTGLPYGTNNFVPTYCLTDSTNCIVHYVWGEGTGTNSLDYSGNNHTGYFQGSPAPTWGTGNGSCAP